MQEKLLWENCRGMQPISWGFLLKSPSVLLLTDRICKEELEAMNTKEEDDVDAGSLVSIESDSVTQKNCN